MSSGQQTTQQSLVVPGAVDGGASSAGAVAAGLLSKGVFAAQR